MPRTRTFTISTLTAVAFAACLAWSGSVEPIHAKAQIPFRLMEATISETQAALEAGTVTSEDLVNMYSRALRPSTTRALRSTRWSG